MPINNYEICMIEKEYAESQAKKYSDADDFRMVQFYMSAALGFKQRAENLIINNEDKAYGL